MIFESMTGMMFVFIHERLNIHFDYTDKVVKKHMSRKIGRGHGFVTKANSIMKIRL